jgi:PKD repeat protein
MRSKNYKLSRWLLLFMFFCLFMDLREVNAQTTINFNVTQEVLVADIFVEYTTDRLNFVFYDSSNTVTTEWFWTFGDGASATTQHTSHTYASKGVYNVCLAVKNFDDCRDTTCTTIDSYQGIQGVASEEKSFTVTPNPFQDQINIRFDLQNEGKVEINMYNTVGKLVETIYNGQVESGTFKLDHTFNKDLSLPGVYFIRLGVNGRTYTKKVIKN